MPATRVTKQTSGSVKVDPLMAAFIAICIDVNKPVGSPISEEPRLRYGRVGKLGTAPMSATVKVGAVTRMGTATWAPADGSYYRSLGKYYEGT